MWHPKYLTARLCGSIHIQTSPQQLHRHVFEGQGGTIGQSQHMYIALQLAKRCNELTSKNFGFISLQANGKQIFFGNVIHIQREYVKGQVGIALAVENLS